MKSFRLFLLPLLGAALIAPLSAQTPAPAAAAVKPIEVARIAYINSSQFLDEATGLKALVKVTKALELEFSGTQADLSLLNEKLRTLAAEINRLRVDPVANAKALEEKQTTGMRMQQELQAKQQQAQAAFSQRQQEAQGPITTEIGKALNAFAKERDIGLLFDVAKLGDAVLQAKPELDLTADFIGYFNAKHP
jgi:Skp family chaperone for outer membrane proteins